MNKENITYKENITFWKGSTILSIRKDNQVIIAGDGQLTEGGLILKSNVKKVRRLGDGSVIAGFTGSMVDSLILFEKLESLIAHSPHQLLRSCVDLAKFWHQDKDLSQLDAMMVVVSASHSLLLTSTGDVFEKEDGIIGIGAGGPYALAAASALFSIKSCSAEQIVRQSMAIAANLCIFTNEIAVLESIEIT